MSLSASCANCRHTPAKSKCSRCQAMYYCNADCQRSDWKRHKNQCAELLAWNVSEQSKSMKKDLKQASGTIDERLLKASMLGLPGAVHELLENGANVNFTQNARSSIMAACARGHTAVVQLLISAGSDINCTDERGRTSLSIAILGENVGIVKILIDAGVNVRHIDNTGSTYLFLACFRGNLEVVRMLISAGTDLNHAPIATGINPLMHAIDFDYVEVVKALISAGADVNRRDRSGVTTLMTAYRRGNIEVIQRLIAAGAESD